MQLSYGLTVSPVLSAEAAVDFLGALLGCDQRRTEPVAARYNATVEVAAWTDPASQIPDEAAALGEQGEVVQVVFSPCKHLDHAGDNRVLAQVVEAVIALLEAYPAARAILTYESYRILLQRLPGEALVLSSELIDPEGRNEWNKFGDFIAILDRTPHRELDQFLA